MIDQIINLTRDSMHKSVDVTTRDLSSIRSGRATPALVEHVSIMAYGGTQRMKVKEMATITTLDAKTIAIAPFDPATVSEIEKGILEANIGLTPIVDGELIRITIPSLTQERRQEYIKLAKVKIEAGKIMIRQARQEAMKDLKKAETDSVIDEDQRKNAEKKIQELTDEMIAEMESLGQKKETELLQV